MNEQVKKSWAAPRLNDVPVFGGIEKDDSVCELDAVHADNPACLRFKTKLCVNQNMPDLFPNSNGPKNRPDPDDYACYTQALEAYDRSSEFDPSKCDRCDIEGHKLHLNIAPKNCKEVSNYLIANGYRHKYLSGGEIDAGKIFTIYVGSRDLANKIAAQLSTDLEGLLCRPITESEIEYAPNVVGRFKGWGRIFDAYGNGVRGICVTKKWKKRIISEALWGDKDKVNQLQSLAFEDSFNLLANTYGPFFYGTAQVS